MKRIGNIYSEVCSINNLFVADAKARRGKGHQSGVIAHDQRRGCDLLLLHEMLVTKNYHTSPYRTFTIFEPKEREISILPYFPDRIVHHAILNQLETVFTSIYTADTYSCVKGRGIHGALKNVKKTLTDITGTQYCLKLDIKKFYPNVNHEILKALLRRKFKDADLLWLLDEIIDSAPGLPIGNYLSQFFANFYLSYFDHWLKEVKGIRYYFRYADDIVVLADNKPYLHQLLAEIKQYLSEKLQLTVKGNYQVFPVAARGIDFVGYRFYHTHILLRPSIKHNFARMLKKRRNMRSIASYRGWLKWCNSRHLQKKLLSERIQKFGNHQETTDIFNRGKDSPVKGFKQVNYSS